MFLPDRIYRMLPFAYIVVGIIVTTEMDSLLGTELRYLYLESPAF